MPIAKLVKILHSGDFTHSRNIILLFCFRVKRYFAIIIYLYIIYYYIIKVGQKSRNFTPFKGTNRRLSAGCNLKRNAKKDKEQTRKQV